MTTSRDQILVDLTEQVLAEATRTSVRLENDGVDGGEAIRLVHTTLNDLTVSKTELAERSIDERRRSEDEDAPDDRELGGQG